MPQLTALLSVSDKTGIVELAQDLHALGVRLLSTGGTAQLLADSGLPVTEVADHTGFPEMLDGRVKTLHPKIHGGLLARRDLPKHIAALNTHDITTIDILCVNLYPFEATVAKPGCTLADAIENIDIGGPAMVRSGAKNWKDVAVLTDASQYDKVVTELKISGSVSLATKFALSVAHSTASRNTTPPSATICPPSSLTKRRSTARPSAPCSLRKATACLSRCKTCATEKTPTSTLRCTVTCALRPAAS